MPLELLVSILDNETLTEAFSEELELSEIEFVDIALVDTELLTVTDEEPVNEGLLEPDTDVLNDNDVVADIESRGDIEELDEIDLDSLEEGESDD